MQSTSTFIPAAHYNILTPFYESLTRPFAGRIWRFVAVEAIQRAPQGGTIVDLGCGPGTVLRYIRSKRPDLHLMGTDIDPAMIRIANRKAENQGIRFSVASIEKQSLISGTVDLALSSMMFHHLPLETKRLAFEEVQRILKPGGVFLLCDFSVPDRRRFWLSAEFWKNIEPEVKPQIEGQLFALAREAGASIETLHTFYGCIALHLLKFPRLNS